MEYQIGTIRKANIQAHDDIETIILNQQNGLLTFTLRINGGNIVDLNVVELVNVRDVLADPITLKELELSRHLGT